MGCVFTKLKHDGMSIEITSPAIAPALTVAKHCSHATPLAKTGEHQHEWSVPVQVEKADVIAPQGPSQLVGKVGAAVG
jgi:hypothetical protein